MSGCLAETGAFLEETVLADYAEFAQVSEQYNDDAVKFQESMNDVHESIVNLTDSIAKISDAISGITSTVGESTVGVTDISVAAIIDIACDCVNVASEGELITILEGLSVVIKGELYCVDCGLVLGTTANKGNLIVVEESARLERCIGVIVIDLRLIVLSRTVNRNKSYVCGHAATAEAIPEVEAVLMVVN